MAFNVFATATTSIPLANLDANFTLLGSAAAASTLYPTATTSITYGTTGTTHYLSGSGVAVTGTLSATGNANFGNAGSSTYGGYATGGRIFSLAAAGGVIPAISASTDTFASSTAIRAYTKETANDTSYAFDIQTGNGTGVTTQKLQLTWGANGLWSSTGLAVTGALSSTAGGTWNGSFTNSTAGLVYCDNTAGGGAILNIRRGRDIGAGSVDAVGLDALNTAGNTLVPIIVRGTPVYIADGTGTTTFSGGNLGLGVTPSAWSSGRAIEIGSLGNAFWNNGASENHLTTNAYYNSGWKFGGTGYAQKLTTNSGQYQFNVSTASGTAGNAITFTQAMTLDSSGRLLLAGATSSAATSGTVISNYTGTGGPYNNNSGAFWSSNGNITLTSSYATVNFSAGATKTSAAPFWLTGVVGGDGSGYYINLRSGWNGSSGGGDAPAYRIQYGGTDTTATITSHTWTVGQTSTGAMVLDSSGNLQVTSGNLLVGTTDNAGANTGGFELYNGSGASRLYIGHVTGTANGTQYVVFNYNGTNQIGSITQSGTTAVLYNTTSDQRLKENIQDADSASSLIDSLQVRQFDWKSDNSHQRYGFIAQELVTVAPEAVHQPIDSEEMMAVDYSKLVPMLVKEIQSLRARVAQLETKGV